MLEILLSVLGVVLLVVIYQHFRYLKIRRELAQDRQRLLHSQDAFHVIVFFKLKSGGKMTATTRRFAELITASSKARLIYAGQSGFTVPSALDKRDWDGALLFEYPSRSDFENTRTEPRTEVARALFADSYLHGMRRNRRVSATIPQILLRRRVRDLLTGKARVAPLETSNAFQTFPEFQVWRNRVDRLHALYEINRNGLVLFSLVKYSQTSFQGPLDAFGSRLLSRMAALSHGPMHIGRTVAVEEFSRFDRVYIVYFPNARYFAELLGSNMFNSVAGDQQLSDMLQVATAPITYRLQQ